MALRAVLLVGFMGAGKSSVGRALGRRLGWRFEDLDERIQARERRTIEQIFRESGEAGFRRIEEAALRDLLAELESSTPLIAALGGGAFVQAENARLITALGAPTVFLDAPVEELWQRCQAKPDQRPLRREQDQFRRMYEARRPGYLLATMRIDTSGKDVETIVSEVASGLGLDREADVRKES